MKQIAGIALSLPWRILPRWSIFICPTRLSSIWSISTSRDQRNIASRLWSQSWRRTSRRRRSLTMSKIKFYFLESGRVVSSSLSLGGWEVVEEGLTRWGGRGEGESFFVSFFYLECTCVSSNAVLSHFDIVQVLSVCEKVLSRLLLSSIKLPAEVDCCQCRSRSRTN